MTHLCLFVAILNYRERIDWVLPSDKSFVNCGTPHHAFELPMIMMWWAIFPKMCRGLTFSVANLQVMQTIGDILSVAETEVFVSFSKKSFWGARQKQFQITKHCQRHNGPEGWVHITSSNTNLDEISSSEFWPSINFKISTKHQPLHKTIASASNLAWTSTSKSWPNLVLKV